MTVFRRLTLCTCAGLLLTIFTGCASEKPKPKPAASPGDGATSAAAGAEESKPAGSAAPASPSPDPDPAIEEAKTKFKADDLAPGQKATYDSANGRVEVSKDESGKVHYQKL